MPCCILCCLPASQAVLKRLDKANAVLTKPLEGTRQANGFVCRLQTAGYLRPA